MQQHQEYYENKQGISNSKTRNTKQVSQEYHIATPGVPCFDKLNEERIYKTQAQK